ncbi:hypothetical protein [Clostridium ganghwense]|uniref:Uncharacterized protein n=1 Tax=Clostridium ganghwense TaxID=312089 RepID=A0ABT4CSY7_9CLOT|nr:hypothetical protein [Clostridium ganghwense]MCY6372195.1 hypothetical protein [Clostridium ganghwense]
MKKFFIAIFAIVTIIVVYNEYPRSGSFNELILSKYPEKQFTEIEITKELNHKICNDIHKINEFLGYLDKLQLIEYKRSVPREVDDIYWISIYDNENGLIGITIENRNFIHIHVSDRQRSRNYKIINTSLDMKYIEDFYNHCKKIR